MYGSGDCRQRWQDFCLSLLHGCAAAVKVATAAVFVACAGMTCTLPNQFGDHASYLWLACMQPLQLRSKPLVVLTGQMALLHA
jgi:hypothetical protein